MKQAELESVAKIDIPDTKIPTGSISFRVSFVIIFLYIFCVPGRLLLGVCYKITTFAPSQLLLFSVMNSLWKTLLARHNRITALDESLYKEKSGVIELAESFARSFYQPVIIVDLYKQDLLFASENVKQMFGLVLEQETWDNDLMSFDFLPDGEHEMHLEIIVKSLELLYSFPMEERLEWSLSYSFYIENGERKRLLHQKITPLNLTPEGNVWLVMCTFSLSSRKEAGHPTLRHFQHLDYFKYSLKKHRWYHKEGLELTDMEREILILSAQGYIMKEMADKLGKSENAIKFYKRQLFAKMGVKNITEAIFTALNDNLLHSCI